MSKPRRRKGKSAAGATPPQSNPEGERLSSLLANLEVSADEGFNSRKYGDGQGGGFDFSRQASLLGMMLQVAVPLWFLKIEALAGSLSASEFAQEIAARAKRCGDDVAEHGDCLMFRVKDKSAHVFNSLAEGIACMAFCPGGVTLFGTHWERKIKVPGSKT